MCDVEEVPREHRRDVDNIRPPIRGRQDVNDVLLSSAGMRVIAAPRPEYPPAPDALALADRVVTSLDELDAVLSSI